MDASAEDLFISRPLALLLLLAAGLPLAAQSQETRLVTLPQHVAGSAQLSAQDAISDRWRLVLIPNGETVYDVVNHVTWLADANLPAHGRFGIPLCDESGGDPCVYGSGAMDYASATAWILLWVKGPRTS